ncbi:MAG: ATP-binding protein [Arachnia sp.]
MRVDWPTLESLTPAERRELLVTQRENQWYERKSASIGVEVFARALIGLANAEGGLIVVGLADGKVQDLSHSDKRLNELRRAPRTHCAPPPRVHFHTLAVEEDGTIQELLAAEVLPGTTMHETTGGECYLRTGDSTSKLTPLQREELSYDRGAAQYEARPMAGVSPSDLDPVQLADFRAALGSNLDDERLLHARSLLTPSGDVTIAGYLLFAPDPGVLMPHAHVRILRYAAQDPGTGARQWLMEGGDVRIEGPIPSVIQRAEQLLQDWVPRRRALRPDGRFGPVPLIPRDAWLEGLVNAVVHRSYSMAGDHIRVSIFPDRLEIESPGRFPGVVDVEHVTQVARYARNPRIARVCNDLGFTLERGEGIQRIFDEMAAHGLVEPQYRQTSGSVRLTLTGATRITPAVAATLPTGAEKALQTLRTRRQAMGTGDIAEAIGLARPATLRALKALQTLGEIEWHGRSPKDPRATWSLPNSPLL